MSRPRMPLEWNDVVLIRALHADGMSGSEIARKFESTPQIISGIVTRRTYRSEDIEVSRHRAKLNEGQVAEIRVKRESGRTFASLGREYGVTERSIRNICNQLTWRNVA